MSAFLFIMVLFFAIIVYLFPMFIRFFQTNKLKKICKRQKSFILTYDDGPGEITTKEILSLLNGAGCKACFFMSGIRVSSNKNIINELIGYGHEIGSHGYAHVNAIRSFPWDAIRDISKGFKALKKTGIKYQIFRPPHGKITIFTWLYLLLNRQRLIWWTHDSGDTFKDLPVAQEFVEKLVNDGGGIVLLHDLDRSFERSKYVLDVTKLIIEYANQMDFKIVSYKELIR